MESFLKFFKRTFIILILVFITIGVCLGIKSYNDTWTIEDGHFKSVYDDYDDCKKTTLGTGTTEICDDENQVKYKSGGDNNE